MEEGTDYFLLISYSSKRKERIILDSEQTQTKTILVKQDLNSIETPANCRFHFDETVEISFFILQIKRRL